MAECDANALLQVARCFKCIPQGMQLTVMPYLLCQWYDRLHPK